MNFHQIFLFLQRIEKYITAIRTDCMSGYAQTITARDMKDSPQYSVIRGVIATFDHNSYTQTEYNNAKMALGMAYNMTVSDITSIVDHIFVKHSIPDNDEFIFMPKEDHSNKIIQFKNM